MLLSKSFCLSRTNASRALVGGAKFQPNQFLPINQTVRSAGTEVKVVLLDDVGNFGKRGDVVEVKTGYARNFLIPKKVAAYATDNNRVKYADIIPPEQREKVLEGRNQALIAFEKNKILTIQRPLGTSTVLKEPLKIEDIKSALAAEGVVVQHIHVYKILRSIGLHHIFADGRKILLRIEGSRD